LQIGEHTRLLLDCGCAELTSDAFATIAQAVREADYILLSHANF
jgi:hypothetical protein